MKKIIKWVKENRMNLLIFIGVLALVIAIIIKIWVVCEYGDMPITEVPSWAVPWLIGE